MSSYYTEFLSVCTLCTYQCKAPPPPQGHRWGFVQLVVQKTHPTGNYFLQCPSLDSLNTLGQRGDLYLYYAISVLLQLQNPH